MNNKRHQALLDIIKNTPVLTQEELQKLLCQAGFEVTQSTVSRDIKQLRIVKTLDNKGNYRYTSARDEALKTATSSQHFVDTFKRSALSVTYALNNVVVKCLSGMASGACVAIDALYSDHLLGSLAGDDTIIIVTKNEQESEFLANKLQELI